MRRWSYVVASIAALEGAAGVVLSAAGAHIESSANLDTASRFLLIHAAAALALAAIAAANIVYERWLGGAIAALQAGVALFAGDLALRSLAGAKLFPYAAPIGGSLVILGWLAAAAWALAAWIRLRRETTLT